MKGIILAGGSGTRLYPASSVVSKQLLPVFDKPMIYYPLSVLMLSGIRDIVIIITPDFVDQYHALLGDGSELGIKIEFAVQREPNGIADAFIVAEKQIVGHDVCLILGDNIFYGHGFIDKIVAAIKSNEGASIFGYSVKDPENYGVAEISEDGKHTVLSIEEKPTKSKSEWAVTGLYVFDKNVVNIAQKVSPSDRGELEITDVIDEYMRKNKCHITLLGRGIAWLDTGRHENMLSAANFVQLVEERQGYKIACIEEIAYKKGFIDEEQAMRLAHKFSKSGYGTYIERIVTKKSLI